MVDRPIENELPTGGNESIFYSDKRRDQILRGLFITVARLPALYHSVSSSDICPFRFAIIFSPYIFSRRARALHINVLNNYLL